MGPDEPPQALWPCRPTITSLACSELCHGSLVPRKEVPPRQRRQGSGLGLWSTEPGCGTARAGGTHRLTPAGMRGPPTSMRLPRQHPLPARPPACLPPRCQGPAGHAPRAPSPPVLPVEAGPLPAPESERVTLR